MSRPQARVVMRSTIAACPLRRLDAEHYMDTGECSCPPATQASHQEEEAGA